MHILIVLINIAPERNEKFLSGILVILLVPITFSLACLRLEANCELNYTPFGVFGVFAPI